MRNKKGQFVKGHKEGVRFGAGQYLGSKNKYLKVSKALQGIKRSEKTRKKISDWNKGRYIGEKHWNWQGGITPINQVIRNSFEYRLWRTAVFQRDGYTCIWGGKEHGKKLNADHIKPFALFPELRFAIDNGRTLCINCHKKTSTYGVHNL